MVKASYMYNGSNFDEINNVIFSRKVIYFYMNQIKQLTT